MSTAHFDQRARIEILGMLNAGMKAPTIPDKVFKTDGTKGTKRAVNKVIKRLKRDLNWKRENKPGLGRNSILTAYAAAVKT